jgi:spore germination cell wall hydrolase CwlJ-like protein
VILGVTAWAAPSETPTTRAPKLVGGELSRIVHSSYTSRMAPWSGEPTSDTAQLFTAPDEPVTEEEASEAKAKNAALPASTDPILAARPFVAGSRNKYERKRAVRCLATAIYFEAALESERGQRAVAQVVLNRVKDPNFPNSVCQVVYQGWERQTGCQFSFTCDGALLRGAMADCTAARRTTPATP